MSAKDAAPVLGANPPEAWRENPQWKAETPAGVLDITINLAKPEKDPRAIAAAARDGACVEEGDSALGQKGHPRVAHRLGEGSAVEGKSSKLVICAGRLPRLTPRLICVAAASQWVLSRCRKNAGPGGTHPTAISPST